MIFWIVMLADFGVGFWWVTLTESSYKHFGNGWFPREIGSINKVHGIGAAMIVIGVILAFAVIATASKRRGGTRL